MYISEVVGGVSITELVLFLFAWIGLIDPNISPCYTKYIIFPMRCINPC